MAGKRTILVVDDNPINRDVLSNFLVTKDYRVEEAVSGIEALEKTREKIYDLILMDLLLPGIDGFETVKEMRKRGVNAPIIAQSSLSFKQDRDRSIESGCNDFLPKPVKLADLIEMVEKHLRADTFPDGKPVHSRALECRDDDVVSFGSHHVLFVEEDEKKAERYLSSIRGLARAERVANGTEALALVEEHRERFDIIVTNMFTSGVDGLGLLAIVKREYPDILVFVYAEKFDHDTYHLAVKLGADGVIPESALDRSIERALGTALSQVSVKPTWDRDAATALQVRRSQKELNRFGFSDDIEMVDVASSTLHDAGGDMAFVRRFNLAGRYGVVVIDVAGHDVVSSYMSAISLGILSSLWEAAQEPYELLNAMNGEILKLKSDRHHICVTALLWDRRRSRIRIATAGNPGGILVGRNSDGTTVMRELEGGGMCLGLFRRNDLYVTEEIEFREGDHLFLFSDGVPVGRLESAITEWAFMQDRVGFRGLCGRMLDAIRAESGQTDDMILAALKATAPVPAGGAHHMFSAHYEEVDKACDWVTGQMNCHPVPAGNDPFLIGLAIREALLNAVEHGNRRRPDSFIDISLYNGPGVLRAEISDEGAGFDLAGKLAGIGTIDAYSIGKRGLPLIRGIADAIEVDGGTVSLLFKNRNGKGDE